MTLYGELHVNDAFHVLFKCPLVANERVKMFSRLDNTCGAYEWERVNTLSGLGIILLSPQDINAAWVVGRFLSEYLAAREILFASSPFSAPPVNIVSSKWLGGRNVQLTELRTYIEESLNRRANSSTPLPSHVCLLSEAWIIRHSRESLDDAFKPVRSWLPVGWESCLDRHSKSTRRSIACL